MASGVHRLVALVEAYPDLKASANFLELQQQFLVGAALILLEDQRICADRQRTRHVAG